MSACDSIRIQGHYFHLAPSETRAQTRAARARLELRSAIHTQGHSLHDSRVTAVVTLIIRAARCSRGRSLGGCRPVLYMLCKR